MPEEWKSRTFKSGNSVALRLPKGLGLVEGDEVRIVPHADGSFSFWKHNDELAVLLGLYGSMSASFASQGRGDIEQDERAWGEGPVSSAA